MTVITVAKNSASTIEDTIKTVLSQNYSNLEYIIIDGCSEDNTFQIAEKYNQYVDILVSEPDVSVYDAMNKGIGMANGDVVGFINADDFYPSQDVITQVANVFISESVDAVYSDLCYVKSDCPDRVVRYWRSSQFVPGSFRKGWCPPHPTFFVRRSAYQKYGGFDLNIPIGADIELMMRFLEVHRMEVQYIPHTLVMMRTGGISNRSFKNVILQNYEIMRALDRHGLKTSWARFLGYKLWSRCKQLIMREKLI